MNARTSRPKKFKYGIEVPSSTKHALYLDHINGFTREDSWAHVIKKELDQLKEYATFTPVEHDRPLDTAFQ
jgi:hypothetical protein